MRNGLLLPLVILLGGCDRSFVADPTPVAFSSDVPHRLDGHTVRVLLTDARNARQVADPCGGIFATLQHAAGRIHWIRELNQNNRPGLTIRVVTYEATFDSGHWTGTTEIVVALHTEPPFSIQHTATLSNDWGYRTAGDALRLSFDQTMSDLIGRL
jgi:hypothetical protein